VTRVAPYGDRALEIRLEDEGAAGARAVADAIRRRSPRGVIECVPGYGSVLVVTDGETRVDEDALRSIADGADGADGAEGTRASEGDATPSAVHVVPAVYDGVDLEDVARACGMETAEVVRRHAAPTYEVEVIGFLPGFGYLGGVDARIQVPRLGSPRARVRAGSIGVAGEKTAIYSLDSPGGWRIVARAVGFRPFDATRTPPCVLAPGDRVRFEPIDAPTRATETANVVTESESETETDAETALVVESIGPVATIQDAGRIDVARWGVPRGGALDPITMRAAIAAVGGDERDATIELPLAGAKFRARGEVVVSVDGERAVTLRDGERWTVAPIDRAVRYVAVRGGVDVPPVLGARGTLLVAAMGGLRGRALRANDVVPVGRARVHEARRLRAPSAIDALPCVPTIDVDRATLDALLSRSWTIDARSDRIGTRLDGDPLPGARALAPCRPLSRPTMRGAIQLPPDGRPIVLGPDAPTTGGYPVIAVLTRDACAALARVRPGGVVRFARA
jgi:KipI family sensor histidine kinase inhibitor